MHHHAPRPTGASGASPMSDQLNPGEHPPARTPSRAMNAGSAEPSGASTARGPFRNERRADSGDETRHVHALRRATHRPWPGNLCLRAVPGHSRSFK